MNTGYFGIYTGIVVDNSGVKCPSTIPSGKVLVHIDGITPTRYKNQMYKGLPASNVKGTLDVESTKKYQVMAKVLMPIMNESSPGIYNANSNENTLSRAVPANQYKQFDPSLRDAPSDQVDNVMRKNNTYGHSYAPDYKSNGGLGVFAVPEPGTRVRIMFENGNLSSPIVIGCVNTSDEFSAIYKSGDAYPYLPKAFQNVFKKKDAGTSSTDETPAAKGGDSELVQEFQDVMNGQLDITRQLMSGNLTDEQKGDLQWKGYQLDQQAQILTSSASDSDVGRLAEITSSTARKQADIID